MYSSIRVSTCLGTIMLFLLLPGGPAAAAPAVNTPKTISEVSLQGTVRLFGCTAGPQEVTVAAYPLEIGMSKRAAKRSKTQRAAKMRRAQARISTSQANHVKFVVRGIKKGVLYRLFVGISGTQCGKVFWRGPEGGLIHAASRRIVIDGFSARSQLEVFESESASWVGADHLDFTSSTAAVRSLRWRSSLSAVQTGELQLSVEPFPISGDFDNCDEPESGIVYRQQVRLDSSRGQAEWQTIDPLNFNAILSLPGRTADSDPLPGFKVPGAISSQVYARILAGSPLYLRVVPYIEGQPACSIERYGVFGWVMLAKVPGVQSTEEQPVEPPAELEIGNGNIYSPPSKYDGGHPGYLELAYRATKPHHLPPKKCYPWSMTDSEFKYYSFNDPIGCLVVNNGLMSPGAVFPVGKWLWFTPKSGSSGSSNPLEGLGGAFVGLATGTFSVLGSFVDYLHKISSEIESTVTGVILKVIQAVDVLDGCSALKSAGLSCKDLVKAGLKIGLTSIGVPPVSIPNWEQLQSQGFDYLAASMANEIANATGVPASLTEDKLRELVEQATKKAIAEITAKRSAGMGVGYEWLIPYEGIQPATLQLIFKKNSADFLPKTMRYVRSKNAQFEGGDTLIPYLFPQSAQLAVPMVLPFNMQGFQQPFCKTNRFLQITCEGSPILSKPLCMYEIYQPDGTSDPDPYNWVELPCDTVGQKIVATYFRDKWIEKNLAPKNICVNHFGRLFTTNGPINIPYPFPQLMSLARVRADQWLTWDGLFYAFQGCA